MRILVADYSGHPFQVQLSRELARRGHAVRHVHFAGFQTPKGNLVRTAADPAGFEVAAVNTRQPFAKASFVRRRRQEIEVGHALAGQVRDFRPDAVLASNNPLDSQAIFQRAARRAGAHFTFWLQDIYSAAISRVVPRKFPGIGHLVAAFYRRLEFRLLRSSDAVVAITADFLPILQACGVDPGRVAVIENWAPLDELPAHPRGNAWAEAHMPGAAPRFVYSGTLGYKHDPGILLALAAHLPECQVHVFSEGEAATALARDAVAGGLANLTVHRWVPFADLPEMLGGADVFVATIEAEAGVYSVPSKILTYLAIWPPDPGADAAGQSCRQAHRRKRRRLRLRGGQPRRLPRRRRAVRPRSRNSA